MHRVLLDTNAYSALLAGDELVLDTISKAERVLMSVIVIGELVAGFKGGSREQFNLATLDEFLLKPPVRSLGVMRGTADIFGEIKHQLKLAGTPIPLNDVWIAAHTIESGAWLVTYDRHFQQVPGLLLWSRLTAQT